MMDVKKWHCHEARTEKGVYQLVSLRAGRETTGNIAHGNGSQISKNNVLLLAARQRMDFRR
tara:strand:- start:292 stop:474 length:183 start_codon:yes stop_codon:yes gene_type:complete